MKRFHFCDVLYVDHPLFFGEMAKRVSSGYIDFFILVSHFLFNIVFGSLILLRFVLLICCKPLPATILTHCSIECVQYFSQFFFSEINMIRVDFFFLAKKTKKYSWKLGEKKNKIEIKIVVTVPVYSRRAITNNAVTSRWIRNREKENNRQKWNNIDEIEKTNNVLLNITNHVESSEIILIA